MARRKNDLAGKLSSSSRPARPGWRETITLGQPGQQGQQAQRPDFTQRQPEPEPANKLKRKTYLVYAGMIDEIAQLAEQERVGINDLVRFLLGNALDQVYDGTLEIPTQPGKRQIDQ